VSVPMASRKVIKKVKIILTKKMPRLLKNANNHVPKLLNAKPSHLKLMAKQVKNVPNISLKESK
jgi:hypothetical protein